MKLKDLIKAPKNLEDIVITGISSDSRTVKSGYAFVCINGFNADGHKFAPKAIEMGASVVIAERDLGLENQIVVEDTHAVYSDMCAKWFGNPAGDLKLIGVTGTNGKTSITYILKSILEKAGYKVGLIGTIQNMIGDEVIVSKNTTPGAFDLNSLFSLMKSAGCSFVIMEASSHALDQKRIFDLTFEASIFTNLTQDHLDYHETMENYLEAKKKLFKMSKLAIVNGDDGYSSTVTEGLDCPVVTYSRSDNSDYSAKAIKLKPTSVDYELVSNSELAHIKVNSGGGFTVYNSLASAVCALKLGIPMDTVTSALKEFCGVKGRAEVIPDTRDFHIIIDYAHTPDGLKNILKTFRDCEKNRLTVLFGCGGDRDKTKRPIMGSIAARYADNVIVTSDNPRSEEPSAIIDDILVGMEGTTTPYKVIENRIEAIRYAVATALKDDIIILAGKGHETYQILKEGTIHLDEREVVREALNK